MPTNDKNLLEYGGSPIEPNAIDISGKLSEPQKAALASGVSKRWLSATRQIQSFIDNSLKAWDYYLNNLPLKKRGSQELNVYVASKEPAERGVRLGYIPKTVDSVLAIQLTSLFPRDGRFFRGTPQNSLSSEKQELYETCLENRMGQANVQQEFRLMRLNQILDGTAAIHVYHKVDKQPRVFYERPTTNLQGFEFEQKEPLEKVVRDTIKYDGVCAKALSFDEWRVDPSAKSMEDSYFLRRWYMPVHKVKKFFPNVDVDNVKSYMDAHNVNDNYDHERKQGMGLLTENRSIYDEEEGKTEALLMVCYDDFVIEGKLYENYVCIVLNDSTVVHFAKNPYNHRRIPYIVAPYTKLPNQIYGMSLVHHALPSAEFIDKAFAVIMNASKWAVPTFLRVVNDVALQKLGSTFQVSPHSIVPVSNPASLQQLQVNVGSLSTLSSLIAQAEQNIQDVTGSNALIQGEAPQQGRVTAFEIDSRIQGTNSRFQSTLDTFTNEVLEPFMEIVFENDRQYKERPEYVNNETLDVDTIRQFDFTWHITSVEATLSRSKRIAQHKAVLMELVPALFQTGLASPPQDKRAEIDHVLILQKFLQDSGYQDLNLILKSIPVEQAIQNNLEQNAIPTALPPEGTQGGTNVFSQPNQSRVGGEVNQ